MGDQADDLNDSLGPCIYCIDHELYKQQDLDEYDDCAWNPDEFHQCELIREAHGFDIIK